MDIKTLTYFLAVARSGNMTSVARDFFVSQSALSRQITSLEQELGKPLFVRSYRNLVLTKEGEHLKERAQEILAMVERTQQELASIEDLVQAELRIGAAETRAMAYLAKAMKEVQLRHPQIRFQVLSTTADVVSDAIDYGSLDFGLMFEPVDASRYAYLRIPYHETIGLLMREDSPLAAKEKIIVEDLENVPLIMSTRQFQNGMYQNWIGIASEKLRIVATYNLIYNASVMVAEGMGSAITIDSLCERFEGEGLVFRPLYPRLTMSPIFGWKKSRILSKADELFLTQLRISLQGGD